MITQVTFEEISEVVCSVFSDNVEGIFKICAFNSDDSAETYLISDETHSLHIDSQEDDGDSSNKGRIAIDGLTYSLPMYITVTEGDYQVSYVPDSGYLFLRWVGSTGISLEDESSLLTTIIVRPQSSTYTLRAIYHDKNEPPEAYIDSTSPNLAVICINPPNAAELSSSSLELTVRVTINDIPVKGANIKFYVDNKQVGSDISDSKGYASFSYSLSDARIFEWFARAEKKGYNPGDSISQSFIYNPKYSPIQPEITTIPESSPTIEKSMTESAPSPETDEMDWRDALDIFKKTPIIGFLVLIGIVSIIYFLLSKRKRILLSLLIILIGMLFSKHVFGGLILLLGFILLLYGAISKPKKMTLKKIDSMDPYEFEDFVANMFKKIGYEVEETSISKDFGADWIIKKRDDRAIVQVKHYDPSNKVGSSIVREALGARGYYRANRAIIVTSSYFTREAYEQARGQRVQLIDRDELSDMLKRY